jgi:hypothetical protein
LSVCLLSIIYQFIHVSIFLLSVLVF